MRINYWILIILLLLLSNVIAEYFQKNMRAIPSSITSIKQQSVSKSTIKINLVAENLHINLQVRNPFSPMPLSMLSHAGNIKLPQYTLDVLKLVGIIIQSKQRWALIKSPEAVVVASTGAIIGKMAARIIAINPTNVRLQNTLASPKNHITILKLRD